MTETDLETYAANEKTSIHNDWGWRDGLIHLYVAVRPCRGGRCRDRLTMGDQLRARLPGAAQAPRVLRRERLSGA